MELFAPVTPSPYSEIIVVITKSAIVLTTMLIEIQGGLDIK
jgi:hypothetical protein